MRIRKLYLKDIGPFDEVEFEFKPQEKGKAEIHILTGPNGSGKTTTLYALANTFTHLEANLFYKRIRSRFSEIKVSFDQGDDFWLKEKKIPFQLEILSNNQLLLEHSLQAPRLRDFAVLAYSGYRSITGVNVNAIQEFNRALINSEDVEFDKKNNQQQFTINQWIANNLSKRAIEREKSNPRRAQRYASTIATLEKVVSEIVGHEVEFDLRTSPLSLVIKVDKTFLDFDVLPDGLRSSISWIGDVLMRLDMLSWKDDIPVNEQPLTLFLDEIEVHLHPAWQRKILPAVQKLFPNAQIFLTTHSPFVVNSIDGAWIYELKVKDGKGYLGEVTESKSSASYRSVLREVFDIEKPFGGETQDELDKFQQQRDQILKGGEVNERQFLQRARKLAKQSEELLGIISLEIKQINNIKGTNYEL